MQLNGSDIPSITVLTSEHAQWTDEVIHALARYGYDVEMASADAPEQDTTWLHQREGIITCTPEDCRYVRSKLPYPDEGGPLLVLVTDDYTETQTDTADLVLPRHTAYIINQLRTMLDLRARYNEKAHENATLHMALEKQQHLTQEVEVLKNAIVRNVSHELKTPLLHVKSAVSLMLEDSVDQKLASYAQNAMGRLETLVKNITLLGSSLDLNPGPVILRDTVDHAVRNLARTWEHREDTDRLRLDIRDNLPPVLADKQGLSTVLQLLMDNALKFSEDDVEVAAELTDDPAVRIMVRDYGIGIAQDQIDTIFDTFYQVDNTSTRRYGGLGVGLALVRLILEHHRTSINVESEVGSGSIFSFKLPLVTL